MLPVQLISLFLIQESTSLIKKIIIHVIILQCYVDTRTTLLSSLHSLSLSLSYEMN